MHGLFALVHDFKSTVHASTEVTLRAYSRASLRAIVHFNRALSGRSSAWLVTSILASKLASVLVILDGRVPQMVACGLLRACSWLKFQASFINYKPVLEK